ncbi:MarR family winged helix-turn-helix transcriptional regulator [Mobilicoccus caccae]|uniref:MarR family transcriptional regulator n=1 Tax=Mobilicoccus caccae TaxID=1859295 RepID=A0ABQ6IVL4_9MICO|nr:MarR family transcriptional regulator [Mobilicoccus caccae]GMA40728.1 MarR family transcriptional regulator [Mobilicoccus caccae]
MSGIETNTPPSRVEPGGSGDEVDRIVAAWAEVSPTLDTAPLQVLSRVSRLARHLERVRAEAFSAHGLEGWEFDVLSALRRAGEPFELSPGALIQQTLSTSGTMTNRVDRLEARGMVERRPDPADRRGVKVRLLPPGVEAVDGALAALMRHEQEMLSALSSDERDALAASLRCLLLPLDAR